MLAFFIKKNRVFYGALLIDESLFQSYNRAHEHDPPKSLKEAKKLLSTIVGVKKVTDEEFLNRIWKQGEEILTVFALHVQTMAQQLELPSHMVKSQFLREQPQDLSRKYDSLRLRNQPSINCARWPKN